MHVVVHGFDMLYLISCDKSKYLMRLDCRMISQAGFACSAVNDNEINRKMTDSMQILLMGWQHQHAWCDYDINSVSSFFIFSFKLQTFNVTYWCKGVKTSLLDRLKPESRSRLTRLNANMLAVLVVGAF